MSAIEVPKSVQVEVTSDFYFKNIILSKITF